MMALVSKADRRRETELQGSGEGDSFGWTATHGGKSTVSVVAAPTATEGGTGYKNENEDADGKSKRSRTTAIGKHEEALRNKCWV